MENSLKQRIIGAIVLIALAIIFLPAILKDKSNSGTFVSKIPDKPVELENYQIDTKKIDDLLADKRRQQRESVISRSNKLQGEGSNEVTETSEATEATEASKIKSLSPDSPAKEVSSNDSRVGSIKTKQAVQQKKTLTAEPAVNTSLPTKSFAEQQKLKINEKFKDTAWVVQVASFSKLNNAINLVKKLKSKNYKAYRRKVRNSDQTVYRVFVGPYIEKKKAEKSVSGISQLSESKAILKPFDPLNH